MVKRGDEGEDRLYAVAAAPAEHLDEDTQARTEYRVRGLVASLPPPGEAGD